jgi:hypothetical protein
MDKVQNLNNPNYYAPSSEPYRNNAAVCLIRIKKIITFLCNEIIIKMVDDQLMENISMF